MEEAKALLEKHEKSLLPDVKIKAVYGQKEYTVDNTYLSFESTLEGRPWKEAYQYAREGERDERYALVEALETQPKKLRGKKRSLTPMRKRWASWSKKNREGAQLRGYGSPCEGI